MTGLFRECYARLRLQEPVRDIRFEVAELPTAQGDVTMLRQAVENLLANALKFTRPRANAVIEVGPGDGGLDSELGTRDGFAVYFVRDNGVGFDPAYAGRLFGVFQRLHSADEFEGTGVGLAIVRRVVERHGGRILAESSPDQGATFVFTLPHAEEAP
jgi:signal transduction histidine kinase